MNYLEISLKLLAASVIGGIIGFERKGRGKYVGIKTHAILCLANCALSALGTVLNLEQLPRIIAGAIQGIGFIGAGIIFYNDSEGRIQGFTSSIILWLTAVIGLICGTTYYWIALPVILCYILIITLGARIEEKYQNNIL